MKYSLQRLSLAIAIGVISSPLHADDFTPIELNYTQSDFGGIGLMQMPTARMEREGEFNIGVTNNDEYINYALSLQLYPWLESTVRYTLVHDMLYSSYASFSGDTEYTDKSIDAKLRLLTESTWRPEVSVGLRDLGGTGLFDGEFIAASKALGNWDFTLGVGWGYIGNKANLTGDKTLSDDCGRGSGYSGKGGSFDVKRMFSGCTSLFGGIEYQTPLDGLSIKLEYDGNDYNSDFPVTRGATAMPVESDWNAGLVYHLSDWANVRMSYERGNTLTLGFTLHSNLAELRPTWLGDEPPKYAPTVRRANLSAEEWTTLGEDLDKIAGYRQNEIWLNTDSVTVIGQQGKYRDRKEAQKRAAIILANSGLDVNQYRLVEKSQGQLLSETIVNKDDFETYIQHDDPESSFDDALSYRDPDTVTGINKVDSLDRFSYGFRPKLNQSFGGSEGFYLYSLGALGSASYKITDSLVVTGGLYANLVNNYDKFLYTQPTDGTQLKRVRTLVREYVDKDVEVNNLQLTYFDRFGHNWYGQIYAGYLESMFAGTGSELLYRPLERNWAIGADINYVKQRDPNSTFGLFKNELYGSTPVQTGTLTGHATLYWQPQFWSILDDSLIKISAGKYLAEDKGVTVDFSKQFDSGVIAGVFATKTNLSAEEYGEGSFTKGFYISIPFDLMVIKPNTSRATISWQPLTRDGGQMVGKQFGLYGMTDPRSQWFSRPVQE